MPPLHQRLNMFEVSITAENTINSNNSNTTDTNSSHNNNDHHTMNIIDDNTSRSSSNDEESQSYLSTTTHLPSMKLLSNTTTNTNDSNSSTAQRNNRTIMNNNTLSSSLTTLTPSVTSSINNNRQQITNIRYNKRRKFTDRLQSCNTLLTLILITITISIILSNMLSISKVERQLQEQQQVQVQQISSVNTNTNGGVNGEVQHESLIERQVMQQQQQGSGIVGEDFNNEQQLHQSLMSEQSGGGMMMTTDDFIDNEQHQQQQQGSSNIVVVGLDSISESINNNNNQDGVITADNVYIVNDDGHQNDQEYTLEEGRLSSPTMTDGMEGESQNQELNPEANVVNNNDINNNEEDEEFVLPFALNELSQHMREWRANKQLSKNLFFSPYADTDIKPRPMKSYTYKDILSTIPHFTRELLVVMYSSSNDEFIVFLPTKKNNRESKCDGGCTKIINIMHSIIYAFRNRYPQRFQKTENGIVGQDLVFLVSTGDSPRLSRDCLARPGWCKRRINFAPILHFGSGFKDTSILPTLIVMPPPPRVHLRCMTEWMIKHEVCEFLLPTQLKNDGTQTLGMIFGSDINYNPNDETLRTNNKEEIGWYNLINQIVWRGSDFPYLTLLNPQMRSPEYEIDVEPRVQEYGREVGGVIRALWDSYDMMLPRWKAILITAQAENWARSKNMMMMNDQQNNNEEVIPWTDMKFGISMRGDINERNDMSWNNLGIPALSDVISPLDLARYRYHIDIGGGGGTDVSGTIYKLALPGLLFHHETSAIDWYSEHLVSGVHYISVKEDLSDLREKYDWAQSNPEKAKIISENGTEFVRRLGTREGMEEMYRKHFLQPLEDVMESFQPYETVPDELLGGDIDGSDLILKEIMRCSRYNVNDCVLLDQ